MRDRQQALLLDALRRAAGAPVSYAELRAAGIELPASVVSELELAGVPIERCTSVRTGVAGVRLDPATDRAAEPAVDFATDPATAPGADPTPDPADRPAPIPIRTRQRAPKASRALAGLAALATGVAIVAVLALSAPGGGPRTTTTPIAKRPHAPVTGATSGSHAPSPHRPANPAPQVPVSPALATQLEAQGHNLLEAGQYGDAVPVLERAVLATGETVGACLEPANSTCLTYAYALYDLGRAERLDGEPQAAVPILERRLQIDNQRSTVGAELQLARQGIS